MNFLRPAWKLILLSLCVAAPVFAQSDQVSLQNVVAAGENGMLRSCLIMAGPSAVRFEIVGAAAQGITAVEIGTAQRILGHRECHGQPVCRLTGSIATQDLKSDVLSAHVVIRNTGSVEETRRQVETAWRDLEKH